MKVLTGILSLMVVAGCATVELASTEDAYKDKWVRVTEGDMDEDSGWKRVKLYVADDSFLGEAGDFGSFVASNGLPDYLYVFGSSQFRTAYSKRGQIYEWTTNPYVLKKTYTWQNYPYALPVTAVSAKPATQPVVTKPKPVPAETTTVTPPPSSGAQSTYETGLKYQYGDGVAQSDAEAAKWFRKAADQGHADAQYQLGVMCQNGWGVQKDANEAQRWFRLAAAQGHAQAQAKLSDSEPAPPAPKPEPKPKPEPQPAPASSQGSTGMPRMPD